jgi:hypothetical protein
MTLLLFIGCRWLKSGAEAIVQAASSPAMYQPVSWSGGSKAVAALTVLTSLFVSVRAGLLAVLVPWRLLHTPSFASTESSGVRRVGVLALCAILWLSVAAPVGLSCMGMIPGGASPSLSSSPSSAPTQSPPTMQPPPVTTLSPSECMDALNSGSWVSPQEWALPARSGLSCGFVTADSLRGLVQHPVAIVGDSVRRTLS